MAFRKSVRCYYRPFISVHRFGEDSFDDVSVSDSVIISQPSFKDCSVLSQSALPLIPLSSIVKSGKTIDGHISFMPNDISLVESRTSSALADFINSNSQSK